MSGTLDVRARDDRTIEIHANNPADFERIVAALQGRGTLTPAPSTFTPLTGGAAQGSGGASPGGAGFTPGQVTRENLIAGIRSGLLSESDPNVRRFESQFGIRPSETGQRQGTLPEDPSMTELSPRTSGRETGQTVGRSEAPDALRQLVAVNETSLHPGIDTLDSKLDAPEDQGAAQQTIRDLKAQIASQPALSKAAPITDLDLTLGRISQELVRGDDALPALREDRTHLKNLQSSLDRLSDTPQQAQSAFDELRGNIDSGDTSAALQTLAKLKSITPLAIPGEEAVSPTEDRQAALESLQTNLSQGDLISARSNVEPLRQSLDAEFPVSSFQSRPWEISAPTGFSKPEQNQALPFPIAPYIV